MNNNKGYTLVELLIALLVMSIGIVTLLGLWNQIFSFNEQYKIAGTLYNLLEYSGSLIWNLESDNDVESIKQNLMQRLSNAVTSFFREEKENFSVNYTDELEFFEVSPNPDGYVKITPPSLGYKPVIAKILIDVQLYEKLGVNS